MNIFLYTLLPVIFMLHEFEEMIFLKILLHKDKNYLHNKFPNAGQKIYSQYCKFTTSGFVLAVAEEFIIITILTYIAIIIPNMYIWFALFMGFAIHIVIHIIQWMLYGKYIPAIVTSILVLPYCVYGFMKFVNNETFGIRSIIVCSTIGIVGVIVNLRIIHYLGHKFSIWEEKMVEKNTF